MTDQQRRECFADHVADQVEACARDGQDIPDGIDMTIVVARTLDASMFPEDMQDAAGNLIDYWRRVHGIRKAES